MNNKIIIVFLIIFLAASFLYLAYIEQSRRGEGSFWSLYFADPKSDNLNFTIENHSNKNNFHWEVLADKDKIKEGDIKIAKGSAWESSFQVADIDGKKIAIIVSDGDNKKEIYKNINR